MQDESFEKCSIENLVAFFRGKKNDFVVRMLNICKTSRPLKIISRVG